MRRIEELAARLQAEFPSAVFRLDMPRNGGSASAWLDVELGGRQVAIEGRRTGQFGISFVPDQKADPLVGLFAGPDRLESSVASAFEAISSLLGSECPTSLPAARVAMGGRV
jgi:hypothetical protein